MLVMHAALGDAALPVLAGSAVACAAAVALHPG
jgi:hypothetical protein